MSALKLSGKKKQKEMSPIEKVTDMMEFSKHGPMTVMFVMDALDKWTDKVITCSTPEMFENSCVHLESWLGTAEEIRVKLGFEKVERHETTRR